MFICCHWAPGQVCFAQNSEKKWPKSPQKSIFFGKTQNKFDFYKLKRPPQEMYVSASSFLQNF